MQSRPPPVVRTRKSPQDQVCRAPKRIVALIKGIYGVARLKDVVSTRQLWQHFQFYRGQVHLSASQLRCLSSKLQTIQERKRDGITPEYAASTADVYKLDWQ